PNTSTFETSSLSVCSDSTTGSEGRFYREEAGKKLSSCSFPTSKIIRRKIYCRAREKENQSASGKMYGVMAGQRQRQDKQQREHVSTYALPARLNGCESYAGTDVMKRSVHLE
ncbi:jg6141, partial [Pararge aegeria aegeria]